MSFSKFILFAVLFFGATLPHNAFAKEKDPSQQIKAQRADCVSSLELMEHNRKLLSETKETIQKQADFNYEQFNKLVDRAIWIIGILLVGSAILIKFVIGSTKNEVIGTLRSELTSNVKKNIDESVNEIKEDVSRFKDWFGEVKEQIDDFSAFKLKPITWVFESNQITAQEELQLLNGLGLNISTIVPADGEDFSLGDPSLIILSYKKSTECTSRIKKVTAFLKSQKMPIPLLVYARSDRVEGQDKSELDSYLWYVNVNFPITLVAQTLSLIKGLVPLYRGQHVQL